MERPWRAEASYRIHPNGRRTTVLGRTMLTDFISRTAATRRPNADETAERSQCPSAACESLAEASARNNEGKTCTRCLKGEQARYRVYTDAMDMAVCAACADEARKLGISVEQLDKSLEHSWNSQPTTESCL
jgi:hypothetical protein